MSEQEQPQDDRDTPALVVGSVALALVIIVLSVIEYVTLLEQWPFTDLPFPYSLSLFPVISLFVLYPLFITHSEFHQPTTFPKFIDQLLFSFVFLLPLTTVAGSGIILLAGYGWSVSPVPVFGTGLSDFSAIVWYVAFFWPITACTVLVGMPSVLISYYLLGKMR